MKKIIVICATLLLTFSTLNAKGPNNNGETDNNSVDGLFAGGTEEFEFERLSDDGIMMAIQNEARVACEDGLCTLTGVTDDYRDFTATFQVGQGNTPYGSSYGGGSGTTINVGGDGDNGGNEYWGITLRYKTGECEQTVNVPKSLYYAVNRYMWDLINQDGTTRRGFTPAHEAMIIFYTTILKQASGCQQSN